MEIKQNVTDLTTGSPIRRIFFFALPLIFGTLFQQLYSFADTVIIGRCLGETALAAVGVNYSLTFLVLGFIQGATVGFGVPVAQSFGAGNREEVHRYCWNGVWICVFLSAVFTTGTLLFTVPLLKFIHTPDEILGMAAAYIKIIFGGLTLTYLYNQSASMLRALGDSASPFRNLLISSALNIVLDYLLIAVIHFGVAGAAVATVFSQGVSGLLNIRVLLVKTSYFRVQRDELTPSARHIRRLCAIGLPMGFEYSVSAIGAVVMQDAINGLGSTAIAAQTAGEKIRQMFTLPMESVGMAMSTYVAQNYGACRTDRIRSGIRDGLAIQYIYCIVVFTVIAFTGSALVYLVLGETATPTATQAVEYLSRMSTLFFIHGSLMIMRNTLQGMGHSLQAIIAGVGELAGRSIGSWLAGAGGLGFLAICYANPIAWGLALIYCTAMVIWHVHKAGSK